MKPPLLDANTALSTRGSNDDVFGGTGAGTANVNLEGVEAMVLARFAVDIDADLVLGCRLADVLMGVEAGVGDGDGDGDGPPAVRVMAVED